MSDEGQQATAATEVAPVGKRENVASQRLRFRPRHLQYAIPYSIAVSVLYLWGYWGVFQINPLEYVGIGDVVKLSVYPLSVALVTGAVLIGVVRGVIGVLEHLSAALDRMGNWLCPKNPSRAKTIANLSWVGIFAIIFFIGLYIQVPEAAEPTAETRSLIVWYIALAAGLWFSVSLAVKGGSDPAVAAIFDSRLLAMLSLFIVTAPIFCAFPAGRVSAHERLRDGCAPVEIAGSRSSAISTPVAGSTYLGYLGDHVFVREWSTGAVVVTRFAEGRSLVLLPLDTRSDGRPTACDVTSDVNVRSAPTERAPSPSDKVT
ncbi:hypothetical protein [Zeimonas arvi]|uniref:Uncharacterized protein n=1 Tax=Zeimonas arvi TaxID=2498847 RepID=A0A5C8NRI1_9BURK|nr:hypothetical protein [Zeimonas arvi]TXL63908.1 hypothetical protein FHP08_16585 [Zeimonas arvi]